MALQGSLSDFGIAEILQLISGQQKTGILHVESEQTEIQIAFSVGRVIRCEQVRGDRRDELSAKIRAAELVNRDQLKQALKAVKKGEGRLTDLLVEQGALHKERMMEYLDLIAREILYRLFEWRSGKYKFESKPPNFLRPTISPISPDTLLMEGFRRMDEWPLVRTKINNYTLVFKIIKEPGDLESEAEALERILDDAFSEFVDATPQGSVRRTQATGSPSNLGPNERRILKLIDAQKSVERLVDLSRLGEFETCKALYTLMDEGFIAPVKQKRPQEMPGRGRGGGLLLRILSNGLVLLSIIALLLQIPEAPITRSESFEGVAQESVARLRQNRAQIVEVALEVHRFQKGQYPQKLKELVKHKLLPRSFLTPPGKPWDYISIGTDYDLR